MFTCRVPHTTQEIPTLTGYLISLPLFRTIRAILFIYRDLWYCLVICPSALLSILYLPPSCHTLSVPWLSRLIVEPHDRRITKWYSIKSCAWGKLILKSTHTKVTHYVRKSNQSISIKYVVLKIYGKHKSFLSVKYKSHMLCVTPVMLASIVATTNIFFKNVEDC